MLSQILLVRLKPWQTELISGVGMNRVKGRTGRAAEMLRVEGIGRH